MELIELIWFNVRGFGPHPDDECYADLHTAYTSKRIYKAYVVNEEVTFYVHPNNLIIPKNERRIRNSEAFYAFRYHLTLDRVVFQTWDKFPNSIGLSGEIEHLVQSNIVKHFKESVKCDSVRPRKLPTIAVPLHTNSSTERTKRIGHASREKPSLQQKANSPRPPSLSLSRKRLDFLADTVTLKETVLKQIHLLNAEERWKFKGLWSEFESLLTGSEGLAESLTRADADLSVSRLQSIHDRLKTLHQNASLAETKAKANVDFQFSLAELTKLKNAIYQQTQSLDVVTEHEVETILADAGKLTALFDQLPEARQELWEAKVKDGLTDLAIKLNAVLSRVLEDAERAIERQLILLQER